MGSDAIPPSTVLYRLLPSSQNTHLSPACNWRGSPNPERMVPSKLNSSPPYAGSLKLSLPVTLKISMVASSCDRRPTSNGREIRTSHEKNALSFRSVLRVRTVPSEQLRSAGDAARWPRGGAKGLNVLGPQLIDAGCAE